MLVEDSFVWLFGIHESICWCIFDNIFIESSAHTRSGVAQYNESHIEFDVVHEHGSRQIHTHLQYMLVTVCVCECGCSDSASP